MIPMWAYPSLLYAFTIECAIAKSGLTTAALLSKEGKKVLGPAMERFYGTPFSFFEKYSPVGSPSDIAQWLKPFIESGAKDLNIAPIASSPSEAITGMAELRKILVS